MLGFETRTLQTNRLWQFTVHPTTPQKCANGNAAKMREAVVVDPNHSLRLAPTLPWGPDDLYK